MKEVKQRRIINYEAQNGKVPYDIWFAGIKNKNLEVAVVKRLERVRRGDLGEYRTVGEGVKELKFPAFGIRIYFAEFGDCIVLLLCAGDKASQTKDIKKAKEYWSEYQSRTDEND